MAAASSRRPSDRGFSLATAASPRPRVAAPGGVWLGKRTRENTTHKAGEGKLLNIYWLLRRTIDLGIPGAVAELGCNKGVTAALLQSVLRAHRPSTPLHVYDSFEGLPQGNANDPPAYLSLIHI